MKEISDINLREVIESELNERFNKAGYIRCPFHIDHTPSLSIKFFPDKNKYKYKCFACETAGDAIDFIINKRNVDYKTARELLGMENEKTGREVQEEKAKEFIKRIKPRDLIKGLFTFVNAANEPIYFKAKLIDEAGKKYTPYYSIIDGKVVAARSHEEVPYNLYNLLTGIRNGKTVLFVEGEKDANTINKVLRGRKFVATSIKNVKNLETIKSQQIKAAYVIGDTGEAGEKYINHIKAEFQDISDVFKIIKLPDLRALGDNKDVTDWFEAGHTLDELFASFYRASNLNNKFDFYCDFCGTFRDTTKGEEVIKNKIANFNVLDGRIIDYVEEEREGVKLVFKSSNSKVIERSGYSTAFDDVKSFKNFLESMHLTYFGNLNVLNDFKVWVTNNFLFDTEKVYTGDRFIELDGEIAFITKTGTLRKNGIDKSIYSREGILDILDTEPIKSDELAKLKKPLLGYLSFDRTITILGTIVNNFAVYQAMQIKNKFHHLLIVGESGTGKSTVMERVIAPLLNIPLESKKSFESSNYALGKDLSTGNYTTIYDEFKPSRMNQYRISEISGTLRVSYDRGIKERGTKAQKINKYHYQSPIIMGGEESYPNAEKALITRSAIVYVSLAERTKEHTKAIRYLMAHEKELNSLGRSLIDLILNLSVEEYRQILDAAMEHFEELDDRPQATACNIAAGVEIFNKLLAQHGLEPIKDYHESITEIIQREVLNNQKDAYSTVEQMLLIFDDMVSTGRIPYIENLIRYEGGFLYMHTAELIARLMEYARSSNSIDIIPLKINDFKKQGKLAKYIIQDPAEVVEQEKSGKKAEFVKHFKIDKKSVRLDRYDISKLTGLGLLNLVDIEAFNECVESESNDTITPVSDTDFQNVEW